jgi:hypothetical protein
MTDLEILLPERSITIGGEEIPVSPFKFGQFKKVLAIVQKVGGYLDTSPQEWINSLGDDAIESLATLALFCIPKDRTWLDELPGDQAFDLFLKVLEVNADFFARKIQEGSTVLVKVINGATGGQSPLPDSLEMDTPG